MAKDFVWAIDKDGKPTKCTAKPENRGKGTCNHIYHADRGMSYKEFSEEYNNMSLEELLNGTTAQTREEPREYQDGYSQDEINDLASRLDAIAGVKVTEENYEEVIKSLSADQLDEINKLGFEAASAFSLPVTDEMYDEINQSNKIYFSELPNYHIGGKKKAIQDMFGSIGPVPVQDGDSEIESNYRDGLSAREYFEKQFSSRGSQVQKTVSVSRPGHAIYVEQEVTVLR